MDGYFGLALRALHVIGVIAWIGGLLAAGLIAAMAAEEARKGAVEAARKVMLYVVSPAMALSWLVGLAILIPNFGAVYARAGWMHGKLTLVLVASALTGVLSGTLRKMANGEETSTTKLRGLALGAFFIAVIVVVLVRLQPGGAG